MIPLCVPNLIGNEWAYIKDCLDTNWVSATGQYVNRFEKALADYTGARYAVAVSSGTTALHISLLVAGVQPGDFVIVPNLTFVATANVVTYMGARPLLLDIDPDTYLPDLDLLEDFLETQTRLLNGVSVHTKTGCPVRALMPVHTLGNMVQMERMLALCDRFGLTLIEDTAEALGSFYKGQHAGTFGRMGCLSFNGNKIITTGSGGIILTNNEADARRAKHLTMQAKASAVEYLHDEVGYNYRLVNLLAAMGLAQMESLPDFVRRKQAINQYYLDAFAGIEGIRCQRITDGVSSNYWHVVICVSRRDELLTYLAENNVESRPLWIPMNRLPAFRQDRYISRHDHTGRIAQEGIMLPCSTSISDADLETVSSLVCSFCTQLTPVHAR
ncbi:LegC family aminotransferase [Fibrella sp. HMF5335]|uniref:LegC family aminotransferase n=1 Tax=Fibrella rubiginis TaxID=2817060 RepID=A0A939GFH3_9BACT|nr:LegC family aminotransferase [Fibrella rubiginis]MBO0936284.1 LegC family aminotransferase [Fibrella rubiginis]